MANEENGARPDGRNGQKLIPAASGVPLPGTNALSRNQSWTICKRQYRTRMRRDRGPGINDAGEIRGATTLPKNVGMWLRPPGKFCVIGHQASPDGGRRVGSW